MLDFDAFLDWLPYLIGGLNMLVTSATLAWVLMTKPDSTSAVAWCLLIIFLPFVGAVFFYFFVGGEVMFFGELVEAGVQLVVHVGELAILVVTLQQQVLYFLRFGCIHKPPPLSA